MFGMYIFFADLLPIAWIIQQHTLILLATHSAICLDSVTKNQTIHELKCHHVFHDVCLERWFLECHFTCPMCHDVFYKELGGGDVSEEETSSSDMV